MPREPRTLGEHARLELQRAGEFERDPAYATALMAAICVIDAFVMAEQIAPADVVTPLSILLKHGTLTPLTDDPDEWQDRTGPAGRRIWQNIRNPQAFSYDGGETYFVADQHKRRPDPERATTRRTAESGGGAHSRRR